MQTLPHNAVQGLAPNARLTYDYLMSGRKLTNLVAMGNLQIQSLTKRISELRGLGLDIKGKFEKDHNGKRYMKYWVETGEDQ